MSKLYQPIRTAAVLGAGVMGIQIAAHLANAGLTVYLLELPSKSGRKNDLVEGAFKKALRRSPPMFYSKKMAQRVSLGNYDEHWDRLAEVDWVIEAVVENLEIKRDLLARLEKTVKANAIVSTNTSGLSIGAIAANCHPKFRKRFLGTHFFNPPRYLKLLELIPTAETDPEIVARMAKFGRMVLGKGVVIAKDTPNFIANRIGVFTSFLALKSFTEDDYTIEEIDTLTGTLIGRPKSATFRTADVVGLDTLLYVAENLYPAVPKDEEKGMFLVPDLFKKLVETGSLGAKAGQGFYKKVDGEIRSLNPETFGYDSPKPMKLGNLDKLKKLSLGDRLRYLYDDKGRAGKFFRRLMLQTLAYSANRVPEIADEPQMIDLAMKWGFGWDIGPFQMWDELGFERVFEALNKNHFTIPDWLEQMVSLGYNRFYGENHTVYSPIKMTYKKLELHDDEIHLADYRTDEKTLWHNSEMALLDLGDGIALCDLRSKANTLSAKVIEGFGAMLDFIENHDEILGLVIGNDAHNFCVGLNLGEVGRMVELENLNPFSHHHGGVKKLLDQVQAFVQRIHYFHKPIVAAVHGRALGGGCELAIACPHIVADAETYIGLVEMAVGLIPAGGGLMRWARWIGKTAHGETPADLMPLLKKVFQTVGTATVSGSAHEGIELGFLPANTKIVMNGDRRLYVAKQEVLCLHKLGYVPPAKDPIPVLGKPARTVLEHMVYTMKEGGYASDYDQMLAHRIAYVLTGGELTEMAWVDDEYLLKLEGENFMPLIDEPKTKERIVHMLKTKKPLRN
ncbi:3-hydroxyacyl-CoA dehydrogenase/enoyl-CoA hydratase family protein [[Limnothrix rosea] IAM M-220]|uniref:3-hydroxyacyl-CoA dehydrogenase/enoyl-CoA hydratase family protein n=1 Tax=[Limnothrix rosea] IAM M-220 TaxID=454133 RepID=UPI00155911B1|nr:3-hydroxyacyl-CoA dehydrogenase/enoyl-CoA hydratase family protein [[Limnothrix rosea] IAM M-220]